MLDKWEDPYPKPVLEYIEEYNVTVVRDDLLGTGSKTRFIDYLIGHSPEFADKKEIVFGSCPAQGWAQVSGPIVCKNYGKDFVVFMAARNPDKYTFEQKSGIQLGTVYHWVPDGMLTVTQKRAKDYVAENPAERALLPLGLEHPSVIQSIEKVARSLDIYPDVVWSVGSSGTLNRGLQNAWPKAEVRVVSVGHTMSEREIGRAIHHKSKYKFTQHVKGDDIPPYPSVPHYDAKVWGPFVEWRKNNPEGHALIWNVA